MLQIQKILDCLTMKFDTAEGHFSILGKNPFLNLAINKLKNGSSTPRNNTFEFSLMFLVLTKHGVSFSCSGLTVGEDASLGSIQNHRNNRILNLCEHIFLA